MFKDIKWVIIDEMSMISYPVLRTIHLRLQQFKDNQQDLFGGCNIILMGDLLQLKPCFGGCISEKPSQYYTDIDLWSIFNMNVLWRNQRHIGDTAYGDLCSRMRVGEYTSADLNTLIERMNYYNINKDQFKESIHLCARRKTVAYYNKIGLEKVSLNQKVYRINCDDINKFLNFRRLYLFKLI